MIALVIVLVAIVAIIVIIMLKKKQKRQDLKQVLLSFNKLKSSPNNYVIPLKLTTSKLSCNPELQVQKLSADVQFNNILFSSKAQVNLDMNSSNFLIYDPKVKGESTIQLRNIEGEIDAAIREGFAFRKRLNIGFIQSGTTRSWCENILGLLPNSNNDLALINWNRMKNFSIDLRNKKDLKFTINDTSVPEIQLERVFQSKDSSNKMIPEDYFTIKVDSFQVQKHRSGPFYYIIDVGSNSDLIPKNLIPWLNYENHQVIYQVGGHNLIDTNMNNIQYRENYLIDPQGYIIHAGLIGLNSMMGLKWTFSEKHVGISR